MHNTGFFPDCYLLSVTDGSISIPYLARYSEIFKKPNFQAVKWMSTFIRKMFSQAELETEGSQLATIFGSPPTPLRVPLWYTTGVFSLWETQRAENVTYFVDGSENTLIYAWLRKWGKKMVGWVEVEPARLNPSSKMDTPYSVDFEDRPQIQGPRVGSLNLGSIDN